MGRASKLKVNFSKFKVERRKVSALVPYENNARTHDDAQIDQICESVKEWGWTNPILVDEDDGILAGHGRRLAALKLAIDEVPVIVARGWSEAQKRAYILADNQLALNAGWDKDLLSVELGALEELEFNTGLIGFGAEFLAELQFGGTGHTDPDRAPDVPVNPVSMQGDVWICGHHRILCGDSTKVEDVERLLAGAVPNLMVTDPPYGVDYNAKWRQEAGLQTAGAYGVVSNDDRCDWREAWSLFPGNVAYVWHSFRHSVDVAASLIAAEFDVRSQIIWVKTRAPISRAHYHAQHEEAFYAEREVPGEEAAWLQDHETGAYVVRTGKSANWRGGRKQTTVWFIEHLKSDTGHSTQKPVECMRRPIVNNSAPGDHIYEPFSGSGTTMIACEMEARRALCMELSPLYVDVAIRRWQDFVGKSAILEGDGGTFDDLTELRYDAHKNGIGCYEDWMSFKRANLNAAAPA